MATFKANPHTPLFEKTLEGFKTALKKKDRDNFKISTFADLEKSIGDLQAKQHSQRRQQALIRIQPFLQAMEQYGKVIEVFCNASEFVAFIWGPIKLLLQIASTYAEAFNELISTYEQIGENLPLLGQYQNLFEAKPHMVRVLTLMYEDILNFHKIALRYFQKPLWKQIFDATWKTYKSHFSGIVANMARHRDLIESQASLSQIEDFRKAQELEDRRFATMMANEDLQRSNAVYNWLRAANVENDQYHFTKTRADYPGTGRWLLDNQMFKNWFDPQFPTIPPLLWLTGKPGAGKTILASLVVEEARNMKPTPTVLFFYCKYEDSDRDNFLAVARSILAQLLKQDQLLLPYFYQRCCNSGEAVLTSRALIEELLGIAFQNCSCAYVIVDGIDECLREERKAISHWFRQLVEDLPASNPDTVRCLFVSQYDGHASRDFGGVASINIQPEHSKNDIAEYNRVESKRIKDKFGLSDERMTSIAATVTDSVKGMFLLAKLIWINLHGQTTVDGLEEELKPNIFPTEINEAYRRIMDRIRQKTVRAQRDDAMMLLGWLVCARRPLKWYEIQCLKSIDQDRRTVHLKGRRFLVSPKDLCESLVEVRADETVEFVHSTAKLFLVDESHINPMAEEIKLATLCIDYLNLPSFTDPPTEDTVLNGDYGFMEYAVLYWVRHLEAGSADAENQQELMKALVESLEIFIDLHWISPTATFIISKRNSDRLRYFNTLPFYTKLEKTLVSTRRQLSFFGNMEKEEIALDLSEAVQGARQILERCISSPLESSMQENIERKYGGNLYKCPRFSCQFFTNGFQSIDQRDKHFEKHDRPFQCPIESCTGFAFGFVTAKDRDKHMQKVHLTLFSQYQEFPTDKDVQESVALEGAAGTSAADKQGAEAEDSTSDAEAQVQKRRRTRTSQQEFICEHCGKVFGKKYNWTSHLLSHQTDKPHSCSQCGMAFARLSDYQRHLKAKHGKKDYACGGVLENGERWGCGKSFSRADILKNHYKSNVGQACRQPLQEEEWDKFLEDIG